MCLLDFSWERFNISQVFHLRGTFRRTRLVTRSLEIIPLSTVFLVNLLFSLKDLSEEVCDTTIQGD